MLFLTLMSLVSHYPDKKDHRTRKNHFNTFEDCWSKPSLSNRPTPSAPDLEEAFHHSHLPTAPSPYPSSEAHAWVINDDNILSGVASLSPVVLRSVVEGIDPSKSFPLIWDTGAS